MAQELKPTYTFSEDRLGELRKLFPEAFEDGYINVDTLKEIIGDNSTDSNVKEHFGLNWVGKRDARRIAAKAPTGTLKPCVGEGINEDSTENLFIEGENLEVLKILRKSYSGKIKMIYIDPPYNTGNDFIYKDDFSDSTEDYLRKAGEKSDEGLLVSNPKSQGKFHANWLSFMYPRLKVAKDLLKEDGSIFISIDDNEYHHLKLLMDEIFGSENFIGNIVWQKSKKGDAKLLAVIHEYVLVYSKNKEKTIAAGLWRKKKEGVDDVLKKYEELKREHSSNHEEISNAIASWYNSLKKSDPCRKHKHYRYSDDRGLYFPDNFAGPDDGRKSRPRYDIIHPETGKVCKKPSTGWRWDEERTIKALEVTPPLIHFGKDETTIPCRKSYLKDITTEPFSTVFYRDGRGATIQVEELVGKGVFSFPKNTDVLKDLILLATNENDYVLDFFAGSGSTAHAIFEINRELKSNRKVIAIQIPEEIDKSHKGFELGYKNIADVSKKRIKEILNKLNASSEENKLGIKVYKLDKSNIQKWQDFDPNHDGGIMELSTQLELAYKSPIEDNTTTKEFLTEIILQKGFPLSANQELVMDVIIKVTSKEVPFTLFITKVEKLDPSHINNLNIQVSDHFVCLDKAFGSDNSLKQMLDDKCKLYTI